VQQLTTWPIVDLWITDTKPAPDMLLLRNLGWRSGPMVVQPYRFTLDGSATTLLGKSGILADAKISPTGHFAAGTTQIGQVNQLLILDLQSGQKVRIQGVSNVSSLVWVQ
jgi:hypothetical protein